MELRPTSKKASPTTQEVEESEVAEVEEEAVLCAWCQTEITKTTAAFAMRGNNPVQVFPNPAGHMKVIITFRAATVTVRGAPTTEYTWFAGYAWSIAYCPSCGLHLGWLFERVGGDGGPVSFYGLLKDALIAF